MTDRKRPGLGLLVIFVTAIVFYGGVSACLGYTHARHTETSDIRYACEEMIAHGWSISIDECIRELRP